MKKTIIFFLFISLFWSMSICSPGTCSKEPHNRGKELHVTMFECGRSLMSIDDCFRRKKKQVVKNDEFWSDSIAKYVDTIKLLRLKLDSMASSNPCADKDEQINQLKDRNNNLEDSINKYVILLKNSSNIRDVDKFYCRAIMEAPLYVPYNVDKVEHCKEMVKWLDYGGSKDATIKATYDVFFPLVEHYKEYNDEIIQIIERTIEVLDYSPDLDVEKIKFEQRIDASKYKNRPQNGGYGIFYLDYIIEKTRSCFNDKKLFKKANFEQIRDRLSGK